MTKGSPDTTVDFYGKTFLIQRIWWDANAVDHMYDLYDIEAQQPVPNVPEKELFPD